MRTNSVGRNLSGSPGQLRVMKFQIVTTTLLVGWSLGLMSYIHSKRRTEIQLNKTNYFEQVRIQITGDVLKDFQEQIVKTAKQIEETKSTVEKLKAEAKESQAAADKKKADLNTCTGVLTQMQTEAAGVETEKTNIKNEFQKKMAGLTQQRDDLKKEDGEKSKVCNYINKTSPEGTSLCGMSVAVKPQAA